MDTWPLHISLHSQVYLGSVWVHCCICKVPAELLDYQIFFFWMFSITLWNSVLCTYFVHIVSALVVSVASSGPDRLVSFLYFIINLLTHAVTWHSFVNDEKHLMSIPNGASFDSGERSPATSLASNIAAGFLYSDSTSDCISAFCLSVEAPIYSGQICCGCVSQSGPCHHNLSSLSSQVDAPRLAISAGFSVVEI